MTAIQANEITPGLVVHLSPSELLASGGCRINNPPGQQVEGPHYFLVLKVDQDAQRCLALTLFSGQGGGKRIMLDENEKAGLAANWNGTATNYFRWQVWDLPFAAMMAASGADNSDTHNRRSYLKDHPERLAAIHAEFEAFGGIWKNANSS